MKDKVVLVDTEDNELGYMEKMEAHQKGALHRAFSIFIFNSKGEILLQKRNKEKYHSGGLWSNTCCSHPFPFETTNNAAHRRLKEEMGMQVDLFPAFSFRYKAYLDQDLIEHELDHVFIGFSNARPYINEQEVEDYRYVLPETIEKELENNPGDYTSWLKICFKELMNHINKNTYYEKVS